MPDGESIDSFLRKRTEDSVRSRYLSKRNADLLARAHQQADRELKLIEELSLAGKGILVQGRGSAANSVVCYALSTTAVDPVGMNLLIERFLSEERGEWPDIDLDLPSGEKREQVIQYVYRRSGELGAAMCANVITFRGKSASRKTGKDLGLARETLNHLSGMVGSFEWKGPNDTEKKASAASGAAL